MRVRGLQGKAGSILSESRSEKEQGAHGGLQVVQQSWKMPSGKPLTKPEM